MSRLRPILLGLGFPTVALAAWAVGTLSGAIPPHLLPSPVQVWDYLVGSLGDGSLLSHLQITLLRVSVGFILGYAAGVTLALAGGFWAPIFEALDPTIQAIRSIPPLAWIPLFLIWLGIGEESKVFLIALTSFFPVYLNIAAGFRGIDRKYIELAQVLNKRAAERVREIYLPALGPSLWTGARSGLGLAWMVVVAAELLGAAKGLGFLLQFGRNVARPEISLACLILFALLGKLSDSILAVLETRTLSWRDTAHA